VACQRLPLTCDILIPEVKGRATTKLLTVLLAVIACFTTPVATAEMRRASQGIVWVGPERGERRESEKALESAAQPKREASPVVPKYEYVQARPALNRSLFQRPPPSFFLF
jgi:hypothetical protein